MIVQVELKFLIPDLYDVPAYATKGSAAVDLRAAEAVAIMPGQCVAVNTGIAINMLEKNYCAVVLPRSGLGIKQGLVLGNLVGLIDNDYQGEVKCFMWNRNLPAMNTFERHSPVYIQKGDRIAQMMFLPFATALLSVVPEFTSVTERGERGFGHTGVS